jgi:hypothetical protein
MIFELCIKFGRPIPQLFHLSSSLMLIQPLVKMTFLSLGFTIFSLERSRVVFFWTTEDNWYLGTVFILA